MKKYRFLFFVVFVWGFLLTRVVSAGDPANGVLTQKFVLDNGLTVLVTEMPASPTVSVFALVKTGSATEGKYLGSGISHFLEHMLFKGTDKRPVGSISREIQALGGTINASTGFDYTIYTITVPSGHFAGALDIVADMLMHSTFDQNEIEKEREVVYGEMRLHRDNPGRYLGQLVLNAVYKQHPYRIPIIGYEELLRPLKREDFFEYYRTHYVPDNTILTIAGAIETSEAMPQVNEAFKDFERQRYVLRNLTPEPPQISMRRYDEEYPTDLTRISMAYAGVSISNPDMFAMDVLAMILGQGESSRLHKDLFRDKSLVRSVSASNFTPVDRGAFEVEATLDLDKIETTIEAVKKHIQDITQNGVTSAELEKTKRQALSQFIFGRLTSDAVANSAASDEAFTGDHEFSKKYVEAIKTLTADDIKRVARTYLTDENLSVVVLKPAVEAKSAAAAPEKKPAGDIKKITLDNGLTILLRENHESPIVAVNLVLNGGTGQETPESNGISELTSRLWLKGTRTLTAEEISRSVESRGASLGNFSGRNSFGFSMNLLSQDIDFGLDLLEDLVKNPVFPEEELVKEMDEVKTGIISLKDSISQMTSKTLRETLFLTHPFRLDGMGTLESVDRIKRRDIVDFYTRFAVPGNMVVSVFGDINPAAIEETLTKRFSALPRKEFKIAISSEPPPAQTREASLTMPKQQAMVMLGFQGVDFRSPDRYAMEVLTSILGSPFSGRIFNTVREQFGNAYTLGGGFTPGRDAGVMSFYVLTSVENAENVRTMLIDLINELREKGVGAQELQEMKTYLNGAFKMGIQTDAALGFMAALDELYGSGYGNYRSHDEKINAVTPEDIKRLAVEYLDFNKAAVVVTKPQQP